MTGWVGGEITGPGYGSGNKKGHANCFHFLFLSSALLTLSTGLKSCMKKKNFSLCPLCKFNDIIYDYKGGNVLRGTWRKPSKDKIIKQDLGNTLIRSPDVGDRETSQPLKDYLWCPAVEKTCERVRQLSPFFLGLYIEINADCRQLIICNLTLVM